MAEIVMELTGCGPLDAAQALKDYKTIEDAVDALLRKPSISGDKYIPEKPKVNMGMTIEQEERCKKGRWLQDKINVVFSAAHSQTLPLSQGPPTKPEEAPTLAENSLTLPELTAGSLPDVDEQMSLSNPQSEKLQ